MSKEIKLLIVENNVSDIQIYEDAIYNINNDIEGEGFVIDYKVVKTKTEAQAEIVNDQWAAAFVDLKLSSENILAAQEGNEVVGEVFQKRRFPIVILSNTPEEISQEFKDNQSILLKVVEKSSASYEELIREVVRLYRTGIINILGGKGLIVDFLNKIFWEHLVHTVPFWQDQQELDQSELEKIIVRYTLSHLNENLKRNEIGDFQEHHPSEFYIYPPINEELFTGDIVKIGQAAYVVLNPACDMVIRNFSQYKNQGQSPIRKAKYLLLCKIVTLEEALGKSHLNEDNQLTGAAKNIIKNKTDRFHFIPRFLEIGGMAIDFQAIKSAQFDSEEVQEVTLIATIASPFLKDVISRFSFYYSRQGAPSIRQSLIEQYFIG